MLTNRTLEGFVQVGMTELGGGRKLAWMKP